MDTLNELILKTKLKKSVAETAIDLLRAEYEGSNPWKQGVEIAVRVELTGMDTENLHLHSCDKASYRYKRMEKPAYWIDQNGTRRQGQERAG